MNKFKGALSSKQATVIIFTVLIILTAFILIFSIVRENQANIKPLSESSATDTTKESAKLTAEKAMNDYKIQNIGDWRNFDVSSAEELYREGEFSVFSITQKSNQSDNPLELKGYAILKGEVVLVSPNSNIVGVDLKKDLGIPDGVTEFFFKQINNS